MGADGTADRRRRETTSARRRISRRDFLKWSAAAGIGGTLGGMGALSALGIVRGPDEPPPIWEIAPGLVDYSLVPEEQLDGPTPEVLRVAQWYDYFSGDFIRSFKEHMQTNYEMNVQVRWDVYTSNEELFHWITLSKRRYDVMFPSNYLVDLMKKANMIYTLNPAWLENTRYPGQTTEFSTFFQELVNVPLTDPYDRRRDPEGNWHWVSVPYFWGTSGLGFRKDRIPREDVEALGYDLMWMDSYQPAGKDRVNLVKKMRMLDDMRDVIGAGLKKAGWEWQKERGTPTGLFPPDGEQWTTNEKEPAKIEAAGEWLFRQKPLLFGYNSTEQGTSLLREVAFLNQAWSGDMMYAIRPDQPETPLTASIDYAIPVQGSTWWIDCAVIHSKSRNLWLAHEFLNFIHDHAENIGLTQWNLYSTPNRLTYETLPTYANGWDMRTDPRLYPNIYAPDDFRICDFSQDVGLSTLLKYYNPLWFDLAAV
ncbi:MAG: substrate-binding domain-containing protein [Methanobacteriota archaeon]